LSARATNVSGSLQKTSTRAEVIPHFSGLSQPLLAGSPRKNEAPSISRSATEPKFQSSQAPNACLYQSIAVATFVTASITEMTVEEFRLLLKVTFR
jgi:hypothetical protein